jgi:hypothetical protein
MENVFGDLGSSYGKVKGQFFKAKLAPTEKVGAYRKSWRLQENFA